jgi:vacuolar iron transporter family protein
MNSQLPAHFKGREAVEHVVQAQAEGIIASTEIHGTEIPGPISAATDAARETAVALLLLWTLLDHLNIGHKIQLMSLLVFGLGWFFWKVGRSAWLGWSRLERLHRALEEERWEIQHHRGQEREELKALYRAKGFEGKLLEEVLDVLMADQDRLLKVMIEEELGLTLEVHEHPLKQGIAAGIGTLLSIFLIMASLYIPSWGVLIAALIILAASALLSSYYEKNRSIPTVIWNMGIGILAFSSVFFLIEYFLPAGK